METREKDFWGEVAETINSQARVKKQIRETDEIERQRNEQEFIDLMQRLVELDIKPHQKKWLDSLYETYFKQTTLREVAVKHGNSECSRTAAGWQVNARALIEKFVTAGAITISDELKLFICRDLRHLNMQKNAGSIELYSPSNIRILVRERVMKLMDDQNVKDHFDEVDVDTAMLMIEASDPKEKDFAHIMNFAFLIVRRMLQAKLAAIKAETREQLEKIAKELAAVEAAEEEKKILDAKNELLDLRDKCCAAAGRHYLSHIRAINMLYFTIFEKENDEQLAARFVNTTRANRDQIRKRARQYIWPLASDNLRTILSFNTKQGSYKSGTDLTALEIGKPAVEMQEVSSLEPAI